MSEQQPFDVSVTIEFHLRQMWSNNDLAAMDCTLDQAIRRALFEDGLDQYLQGHIPGPDAHIIEVKEWVS